MKKSSVELAAAGTHWERLEETNIVVPDQKQAALFAARIGDDQRTQEITAEQWSECKHEQLPRSQLCVIPEHQRFLEQPSTKIGTSSFS
ncbi:hypothetical protein Aduo_012832 [Ancylostoma duodenale]